jgi:hypothetical protein
MRRVFIAYCKSKRMLRKIRKEMRALGARVVKESKKGRLYKLRGLA